MTWHTLKEHQRTTVKLACVWTSSNDGLINLWLELQVVSQTMLWWQPFCGLLNGIKDYRKCYLSAHVINIKILKVISPQILYVKSKLNYLMIWHIEGYSLLNTVYTLLAKFMVIWFFWLVTMDAAWKNIVTPYSTSSSWRPLSIACFLSLLFHFDSLDYVSVYF